MRAACLRVCMGGRTMEGKGKTRLRNEQASENKTKSKQIPHKQKGPENKISFSAGFFENVSAFQTPTGQA